jgi:hypothetical protein
MINRATGGRHISGFSIVRLAASYPLDHQDVNDLRGVLTAIHLSFEKLGFAISLLKKPRLTNPRPSLCPAREGHSVSGDTDE